MKARKTDVETFEAATLPDLKAAVQAWLAAAGEADVVAIEYRTLAGAASPYTALIHFTKE